MPPSGLSSSSFSTGAYWPLPSNPSSIRPATLSSTGIAFTAAAILAGTDAPGSAAFRPGITSSRKERLTMGRSGGGGVVARLAAVLSSPPISASVTAATSTTPASASAAIIAREGRRKRSRTPRKLSLARMSHAASDLAETVVMKFGGTSVADAERIKRASERIAARARGGNRVAVVLSARGKTTDDLIRMANEVSARPDPREMDMLLSTGERISCALAAMVLKDLGFQAESFSGSQAGIVTDSSHTKARIIDVRADRVPAALDEGKIALVAGFQGTSAAELEDGRYKIHGNVTTLGRGGSDTTAVAIAAALGADVCEIYTDVDGVYSADPRIVPDARKLPHVSFEEMLEMAASGAKVLQLRSVEYARNHAVRIHCRSSFNDAPGTLVLTEEETMERPLVTAVTHSTDEARVTLTGLPDTPGVAGRVMTVLAEANINVDMIIQNEPETEGQRADMSFTVPRTDLDIARETLERIQPELGFGGIATDPAMGKVSLVGAGMKSHPGVAAKTFSVLGDAGVNIEMISTSPIKIACVVREADVERAVRDLHAAFELGEGAIRREDPRGIHRPVVS